jgi:signal transduction histidine kinase
MRINSVKTDTKDQLEHITQEMYVKNMELAESNRTLSLLRKIDLLVLGSRGSIRELSGQICQSIVEAIGCNTAVLLTLDPNGSGLQFQHWSVRQDLRSAVSDDLAEQLAQIKKPITSQWLTTKNRSLIIDVQKSAIQASDPFSTMSKALLQTLQVKSLYMTKLTVRNNVVGVMIIGLADSSPKLDDMGLFERLSEAVGVAIDNKLLFEENQQVLKQLEASNQKLQELDRTKDEFISMASHQLRTPLTAVKGYLSMVLEGDAGPVTTNEKEMIQRAFDSAQRMVYLIADLLNVSRLQSGKFIIENKPTNLADVVETELSQLAEAIKNHQLTVVFNKPQNFPVMLLDETKIRQVIMNFLDNAIYYTPAGGTITVALQATDTALSFTVTDTGLGVPKSEQPKLFTKFYRAGNARKARPDGTGLGLFMAKKVVVAQGGAIIFRSVEGKGSTFGFSFPRVPPPSK